MQQNIDDWDHQIIIPIPHFRNGMPTLLLLLTGSLQKKKKKELESS